MSPFTAAPSAPSKFFQWRGAWWFMVAVLVLVAVVRLRLLNFPLERDEGEYAYSGQLMLQGIPPYQLAYNMKFPGTYAAYALIMALFGQTPAGIHFGVLCMTTATALMLLWLGKTILDATAGIVAATCYAILAASPLMLGLAGHATHFAAFFATAGLCVMWRARQNGNGITALTSGILFGIAVLMKQHAALIGAWAGIAFVVNRLSKTEMSIGKRSLSVAACGVGMILPFAVCCFILWRAGVFQKFWFWTIDYALQYALLVPMAYAPEIFARSFYPIFANGFLLWLLAVAGLVLIWFDDRLKSSRLWLWGFCVASALSVCPDFDFRRHYFLLALPAVALSAGCAISGTRELWRRKNAASCPGNWPLWICAAIVTITILASSRIWFKLTPVQCARAIYGPNPFPEAEVVAKYIRENSRPDARVAVLGSEPEIYFLAHRHSATGYIYTYGLMEPQPFAPKMQDEMIGEIETNAPKFIIFANEGMSWMKRPDSDLKIFRWWNSYQTNYALIGLADIISPTQTVYALSAKSLARYGAARGSGLEIYQRKNVPDPL
ncbi:MAG: ArnT family glycosyltransferase [Limisphaerales bacterium]